MEDGVILIRIETMEDALEMIDFLIEEIEVKDETIQKLLKKLKER